MKPEDFIHVSIAIPADKIGGLYAAVAALLGSAAPVSGNFVSGAGTVRTPTPAASVVTAAPTPVEASPSAGPGPIAAPTASPSDGAELDAAGVPWDANRHAATKSKTKAGLWRMKVGVTRPDTEGEASANYQNPEGGSPTPPPPPASEPAAAEDDEFAAFRNAAADSLPPPPPSTVARTWSDADLSKLCNQAALASGSPEKVKEIINKYVGDEVSHSRNVPADQRENFAEEIELAFGFQYAND